MLIDSGRVNNPQTIDAAAVQQALSDEGTLVIQFSDPAAYAPDLLASLNAICAQAPDALQIRFYGHYGSGFDAANLRHLPAVKNLTLDCLTRINNEDTVAQLPHLRRFGFGVFEYSRPDFLSRLDLTALTALSLGETRRRDFDLKPLATAKALTELRLQGHSLGMAAIAALPALQDLHLGSIAAKQTLEMIGSIANLRKLTLLLGGRSNLDEMSSKTLEHLDILRVKGLASLGNLARFPALRALRVEDQLQMASLDLTPAHLERLQIYNCKTLRELAGLDLQIGLQTLFISQTALDMDALRDRAWPASLQRIRLMTSRQKWNTATAALFASKGLSEQAYFWF